MDNITMKLRNKTDLTQIMLGMSDDYYFKKVDKDEIVCLKKHTKTLVKVFLAEDNVHYERFLINYAENFSERYVEDYDEYHRALHRLLDKCKCKHLKFVMVKAECAIYSYTEQGDFFLNHKFYVLNNYSVETLLKQKLC